NSVDSQDLGGPAAMTALEAFLGRHQLEPRRRPTTADLAAVVALRPRLRAVWQATGTEDRAGPVNDPLRDSGAPPRRGDPGGRGGGGGPGAPPPGAPRRAPARGPGRLWGPPP